MKDKLESIRHEATEKIASVLDLKALDNVRIEILGKKGSLTALLRGMGQLSEEERPVIGALANQVRSEIEIALSQRKSALETAALDKKLSEESIDITLSPQKIPLGHQHPLYKLIDEVNEIFFSMGFRIAEGPEIEWVRYNFDELNLPLDHPSRDEGDTFYINPDVLLRTQTSPVQIRAMKAGAPPIKIIAPGTVYRRDEIDATHSPMFHQLEGLVVGEGITMADLKGTLNLIAERLYGEGTKTVFRPHQFYFTEPSAEMDATCFVCHGEGCRVCKGSGFIELLGCGMVHPEVLRVCGIDPDIYSGFAFGLGLDRMAMFKYQISDLRLLYSNDTEFLSSF
jgi:phenylalanyl-tRNA synthetase alpha chain